MLTKKIFALLFLLTDTFAMQAQRLNKPKLDSLLDAVQASNKGMGSLALSYNGQLIYQRAIGYADVPQKIAATPKTKYRIGSITKVFTGVMIFQLIEEGKLTLTTPLSKFYPEFPNAGIITIGMMLQHRTGLHNFTNDEDYVGYMLKHQTEAEMVARLAKPKAEFAPDSKFDYSNTNFLLLGYIIEKLTKKTYAEAVKQRIVTKADLTDTYYGGKINTASNEALSYKLEENTWKPDTETDMSVPGGAGAMVSTPTALTKFIEALFAGKLVSPADLTMMKTMKEGYGMAMIQTPAFGKIGYGHTGGIDGFGSQVIYFPDDKFAIAFDHNGDAGAMGDVIKGALSIYFGKPYQIPDFTSKVADADLDKYLGEYSTSVAPMKFNISKSEGVLYAQATGQSPFPLRSTKPDVFEFSAAGIVLEFEPAKQQFNITQNGHKVLFTKGAAGTATAPAFKVKSADLDKYLGVYAAPGFPLKITVTKQDATLIAQATGQGPFPLNPTGPDAFDFKMAGVEMKFDPAKNEMTLKQGANTTIFTKEK